MIAPLPTFSETFDEPLAAEISGLLGASLVSFITRLLTARARRAEKEPETWV